MASLLHHLEALGWGWVAIFVLLDAIAIGGAVVSLRHRTFRWRAAGLAAAGLATVGVPAASLIATVSGLNTAFEAVGGPEADPSQKARTLAEGISLAMNATAFGIPFTLVAGVAAVVALVGLLRANSKEKPTPSATGNGSSPDPDHAP